MHFKSGDVLKELIFLQASVAKDIKLGKGMPFIAKFAILTLLSHYI
jgi:hypothetical protein